jgi:hypothetical protein
VRVESYVKKQYIKCANTPFHKKRDAHIALYHLAKYPKRFALFYLLEQNKLQSYVQNLAREQPYSHNTIHVQRYRCQKSDIKRGVKAEKLHYALLVQKQQVGYVKAHRTALLDTKKLKYLTNDI